MSTAVVNKSSKVETPTVIWSVITICVLAVMMLGIEAVSRFAVPRISNIEGRTQAEKRALFAPAASTKPVVVVLGNSLLDAAVQFPSLQRGLSESVEARRLLVEQTAYYDWYFGIKRLLARGIRADTIVLMLSPGHLIRDDFRGEYSANLLMTPQDVFELAREKHLHPTDTANLVFATVSSFYGLRSEIRKVLLGRLMPDVPQLTWRLVTAPSYLPADGVVEEKASRRLKALDELCRQSHVRFIFMPAPTFNPNDGTPSVMRAAQSVNVTAVAPTDASFFTGADFPDGYHAAPPAAVRYTAAALQTLRPILESTGR